MKKLFISQPMKGKTNKEIIEARKKAINFVKQTCGDEIEVIDSFFMDAPVEAKPLWFLGKSLQLLSTADIAYFGEGWKEARGCIIEHACAIFYDIKEVIKYPE